MQNADPFNLQRFVNAQDPLIDSVRAELVAGRKQSHWMWFVFPQIEGLGASPTAKRYAIHSLAEAKAYLAHPLLSDRLRECTGLVCKAGQPIADLFGFPDWRKFISCMTLFDAAATGDIFAQALNQCCNGERDALTLHMLASMHNRS